MKGYGDVTTETTVNRPQNSSSINNSISKAMSYGNGSTKNVYAVGGPGSAQSAMSLADAYYNPRFTFHLYLEALKLF